MHSYTIGAAVGVAQCPACDPYSCVAISSTFLMSSSLLLQLLVVTTIASLHVVGLKLALQRFPARTARAQRRHLVAGLAGIALIDLPLYHLFGFYKTWHPEWIDQVYQIITPALVILHANATAISLALAGAWMVGRVRARFRTARTEQHPEPLESTAPRTPALPDRRRMIQTAGLATVGILTSGRTLSAMLTTDEHVIERVVVKIPNLAEGLRGTTMVLLSDLHSSIFMGRREMEHYVAAANELKADIAVVTGDFVNSKLVEVYPFAEAFAGLHAPLGVYGVTGNHDYYTREIGTVAREVEQCGITLLRNANTSIERNGERLWLMGMDDADIYHINQFIASGRTEQGTIENLVAGIPNGAPRIMLCHKPYPFEEYSALGADLMLSGHTHGGQVVLAHLDTLNLSFASLASRYVSGLYLSRGNGRSQMYVSRGIGTVGLPMRLNCPPEITHITLV